MRETSNPVFRSLPKQQGGYAQFGTGAAGAAHGDRPTRVTQPYTDQQRPASLADDHRRRRHQDRHDAGRAVRGRRRLVLPGGGQRRAGDAVRPRRRLGGLALVLVATFGRKQDNPAIVLTYAALEGLFLGAVSFLLANFVSSGANAGAMIGAGDPRHHRRVLRHARRLQDRRHPGHAEVHPHAGRRDVRRAGADARQLRAGDVQCRRRRGPGPASGGPLAIIFSLVCIGLAAFSFLLDFDSADQMIRAGAPEKAAWGVALGLTVTLVWLYIEILRLLSYFNRTTSFANRRRPGVDAPGLLLLRVIVAWPDPASRLLTDRDFVHRFAICAADSANATGRSGVEAARMLNGPFIGSEALANGLVKKHRAPHRTTARSFPMCTFRRTSEPTLEQRTHGGVAVVAPRGRHPGLTASAMHGSEVDRRQRADRTRSGPMPVRRAASHTCDMLSCVSTNSDSPASVMTTLARTAFDIARRSRVDDAVARLDALGNATGLQADERSKRSRRRHRGARGLRQLEVGAGSVRRGRAVAAGNLAAADRDAGGLSEAADADPGAGPRRLSALLPRHGLARAHDRRRVRR